MRGFEFRLQRLQPIQPARAQAEVVAAPGEFAGHAGAEARAGADDDDVAVAHSRCPQR